MIVMGGVNGKYLQVAVMMQKLSKIVRAEEVRHKG